MREFGLRLLLLSSLLASCSFALDPDKLITQYDIRVYTAKDGLPMNSVKKVFQDSRGYIWIGTQEGLARFDGAEFRVYDKSRYPGLRSNFIWDIAEDRSGNLWLATQGGGISRFDGTRFTSYDTADGLAHNVVNQILLAADGSLLFATENGLSRFREGRLSSYHFPNDTGANDVRALLQDPDGTLFVGRSNYWLSIFPAASFSRTLAGEGLALSGFNEARPPSLDHDSWKYWYNTALCRLRSGEIITGTLAGLLLRFTRQPSCQVELVWAPESDYELAPIRSIIEDRHGALWLCAEGKGIVRYYHGRAARLTKGKGLPFENDSFNTIMEDREGSIWIGGDRLIRLCDKAFTSWGAPEGLPPDYGHSVCANQAGVVCAGFKWGGVALIRDTTIRTCAAVSAFPSDGITTVYPAAQGGFWIGFGSHGISWLSPAGAIKHWDLQKSNGQSSIRSLLEDQTRHLWAGGVGCLNRFDGTRWQPYWFDGFQPARAGVTAMLEMAPGDLWFGTFGAGLHRLSRERFNQEAILPALRHEGITLLFRDREGAVWIGTDNQGLFRYAAGRYDSYTARDGLFDERIFAMLEDDSLNYWFSCNKGIFKAAKKSFTEFTAGKISQIPCAVYNQLDGMREPECNGRRQPSGWKSPDGRLWFTSIAGFVSVDPNHLPHNPVPPPVYIESVRTDDSLYLCVAGPLRLAARERDLRIDYTGLSFAIPERVRFRIKLEGYDEEWRDVGSRREADYTNLPKGRFTFRVTACNNDGVWNETGAAQAFLILPFWYETWWAWGGYALLGLGLAGWTTRKWYRRQFLKQQLALKTEHTARLEELNQAKSRFFAGISHEFRTPLTLIAAPLEELVEHKGNGRNGLYAMMLRNTRRLQGLVDQLLDLAQVQSGKITLQAQPVEMRPFLATLVASFESLARRRRIALSLASPPADAPEQSPLVVWIDPEKLEKVLSNLLDNALKYTPHGGWVRVTLQAPFMVRNRSFVEIAVADNGPGIPEEVLPHLFDYFYRYRDENRTSVAGAGIGLAIGRELVEAHYGEITVQSTPGQGSIFAVLLPLGNAHLHPEEIVSERVVREFDRRPPRSEGSEVEANSLPFLAGGSDDGSDRRASILIVEDNPDMRALLRHHLTPAYRLLEARDGKEGLHQAQLAQPDLILSDVMMPGMDGFELARALQEDIRTSHIPVLLLTARGGGEEKLKGLNSGASDYLTKPFNRQELLLRVANLIRLQEQLRQRVRQDLANLGGASTGHPITPADARFLQNAVAVVGEHCADAGFAAAGLAQRMGMSRAHLNRKLVALAGMKTNQFIRTLRLQRAAELLHAQAGSVGEVAFAVGFNHLSYFAACFREQYGCSPSDYSEKKPASPD